MAELAEKHKSMNFEPQKFFIGLMDFFSILLPGALLTYFLQGTGAKNLLPKAIDKMSDGEWWMVVAVSSYLLGHFLFLLGSWLDEFYDFARSRTLEYRVKRLWRTKHLPSRFWRALSWLVFKRERNVAVDRATQVKKRRLAPLQAQGAINTFQWAKARLALEKPSALEVVQRFEADSKFFRSLVPLLLIVPFLQDFRSHWMFLLLVPLALWRYMEQRHKATNQAYWFILALEDGKTDNPVADPGTHPSQPTHAGGVVYRQRPNGREYLLVQASRRPEKWVLPKGHIEPGEQPEETAIREVHEETGVWAEVEKAAGSTCYEVEGKPVHVRFFLMQCREEPYFTDPLREHKWLSYTDAKDADMYSETKNLLEIAENRRHTDGIETPAKDETFR